MKKLIGKILLTIIIIGLCFGIVYLFQNKTKSTGTGYFTFIVEDINNEVIINEKIEFDEDDVLTEILIKKYQITYEEDLYGIIIYGIGDLQTNWEDTYLAIYLNGTYSSNGLSSINLENKMELKLVETRI